jgi:hypothetical protein
MFCGYRLFLVTASLEILMPRHFTMCLREKTAMQTIGKYSEHANTTTVVSPELTTQRQLVRHLQKISFSDIPHPI